MYQAVREDGTIVTKGEKITNFRGEDWTFGSVTHPRKLNVYYLNDPKGPKSYPNMQDQEFYASVFDVGIWDTNTNTWTFEPDWDAGIVAVVENGLINLSSPKSPSTTETVTPEDYARIRAFHDKWSVRDNQDMIRDLVELVISANNTKRDKS